jgi:hypothetical protein
VTKGVPRSYFHYVASAVRAEMLGPYAQDGRLRQHGTDKDRDPVRRPEAGGLDLAVREVH